MSTAILQPQEIRILAPKQPDLLPNAFPGGIGRIPSNPLVAAIMTAIAKGGKQTARIKKRVGTELRRKPSL
jgi:hypothetical protein